MEPEILPEDEALAESLADEAMTGLADSVPAHVREEMRAALVDELLLTPAGLARLRQVKSPDDPSAEHARYATLAAPKTGTSKP